MGAGAASAAASSSGRGGVAQRRNPVADVAGSAAGTPRDTSPASVSAVAGLFNSGTVYCVNSLPCMSAIMRGGRVTITPVHHDRSTQGASGLNNPP